MHLLLLALPLLVACRNKAESGDDSQDVAPIPVVTDLTWHLHAEVQSLVYVDWTQSADAEVHVEYSFDDGVWVSSPTFTARAGVQEQLIAGIPFATTAQWRVVPEGGESVDGEPIATGALPEDLPLGTVTVSDPSSWLPGANYMLTSINKKSGGWTGGEYWTFILDRQARVVWAHVAPQHHWTLFTQVSVTGDYFMWDEATYWSDYDEGEGSTVHKAWLDEEIEQIATPGLHHAFVQLPDETLVWGSQYDDWTEALVEMGPTETQSSVLWTCQDNWPGSGDCESNGLFYVEGTDSFLYSFYTNNSIVEVDHQTGESLWWAGEVAGGYAFDPESSQYSWQHGITYTDAGTLLVSSEYHPDGQHDPETWLLEYDVDAAARTLHYVWGNSSGAYAGTNGDAWRLANGNTLHMVGTAGVIREVDPAGTDVWRVEFEGTRLLGRGQYIEDLYTLVKPRE